MINVEIRFLREGMVTVKAPAEFTMMTAEERLAWADSKLESIDDKVLVKGMSDHPKSDEHFFDEKPLASAVEVVKDGTTHPTVATSEWLTFCGPREIVRSDDTWH